MNPRANFSWQLLHMESVRGSGLLRGRNSFSGSKHRDAGAQQLEKISPRQLKMMNRAGAQLVTFWLPCDNLFRACNFRGLRFHRAPPCIVLAACCTAATMRGCAPHRQIFPCNDCVISTSLGFGVAFSSPTLLMIIPDVQYAH